MNTVNNFTALVMAWNVNNGELNNLAFAADVNNLDSILAGAQSAYLLEVVDSDDLEAGIYDAVGQWEEDGCQIVGLIDGHPAAVTGAGIDLRFMVECLKRAAVAKDDIHD